jgi:hypothetical protein
MPDDFFAKFCSLLGDVSPEEERQFRLDHSFQTAADYRTAANLCLKSDEQWSDWEHRFLSGIPGFPHLSNKQKDVLRRLCLRAHVRWQ